MAPDFLSSSLDPSFSRNSLFHVFRDMTEVEEENALTPPPEVLLALPFPSYYSFNDPKEVPIYLRLSNFPSPMNFNPSSKSLGAFQSAVTGFIVFDLQTRPSHSYY